MQNFEDNASIKKLEEYKSFVYFYEGMLDKEEATNQVGNQQQVSVSVELHSEAKL